MTSTNPGALKPVHWLHLLVVIAVAVRIGLAACYEPVSYPDTGTYISAAHDLRDRTLARSEGRRTPGYPALVALADDRPTVIWYLQMLCGLATSVLVFYIALSLTNVPAVAFVCGLAHTLDLQQLFFEAALLSETLSTLTIAGTVLLSFITHERLRARRSVAPWLIALGLAGGAAILVRPQFVFLLLLLPLLVAIASRTYAGRTGPALSHAAIAALPMLLIVLAWAGFLYSQTRQLALTTQSGFSVVNHSVAFIELAPDRDAVIRDILLRHREIKRVEQGHYGNTGWSALPELQKATGLTIPELSRELQRISAELFVAHPLLYARSVARAWIDFWSVPIAWEPERLRPGWVARPLELTWWVEHKLLRLANLGFVLIAAAAALSARVRTMTQWDIALTTLAALVLFSSVTQALADYGASSRYAVTIQTLVVVLVVAAWYRRRAPRTLDDTVLASAR